MTNSKANICTTNNVMTNVFQYNQEILLGFSLALISQTQLRFPGLPFGLGELIAILMISYHFFVWIKGFLNKSNAVGFSTESINLRTANKWSKLTTYYILTFGFIFTGLVLISTFIWLSQYQPVNVSYMKHNVLSYLFVAVLFLFFLRSRLDFNITALSFTLILLSLLIVEFFVVPAGTYFYENVKLRGLSTNPNQLALYLLLCPLFLINCNGYKFLNKYTISGLILIIAIMAYLIHSSAYFVAYFSCFAVYFFLLFIKTKLSSTVKLGVTIFTLILAMSCVLLYFFRVSIENSDQISVTSTTSIPQDPRISSPTVTASPTTTVVPTAKPENSQKVSAPISQTNEQNNTTTPQTNPFVAQSFAHAVQTNSAIKAQAILTSTTKSQNIKFSSQHTFINFNSEANVRLKLWIEALNTVLVSPLIGLGAGVGVLQAGTDNLSEVHNTFLDLSVQSGIIGLLLYLLFLIGILIKILQQKNTHMALLMYVTLISFSMFHFIFRQPIVWFYLAYMLQISKSARDV